MHCQLIFFHFSWHIADDPCCTHCNLQVHESIIHVLRECLALGDFWRRLVPPATRPSFFFASTNTWLFHNLNGLCLAACRHWAHLFGVAVHFLWCIRNEEIFERLAPTPEEIFNRFQAVLHGRLLATVFRTHTIGADRQVSFIGWELSPSNWVKINSDGSVLDSVKASCGGLIRDDSGAFLDGFSMNLGSCLITIAEVWGALYGLELAWNKGFHLI